ncbi:MAG: SHOCT domain-containing protein [Longimicrobiales bacterium]
MQIGTWGFLGMHFFWWLFWVLIIVGFASLFTPVPRDQARQRESPLALLQQRYAAGEISTEDYEQRRAVLMRDAGQGA